MAIVARVGLSALALCLQASLVGAAGHNPPIDMKQFLQALQDRQSRRRTPAPAPPQPPPPRPPPPPPLAASQALSQCCRHFRADCVACKMGMTAETFCQKRMGFVPGCERYLTRTTTPAPGVAGRICPHRMGGFQPGMSIVDAARGHGVAVCEGERHGTIGICQSSRSGHDNYEACKGGGRRPSFCGPKSLWFVRCTEVKPERAEPPTPPSPRPGMPAPGFHPMNMSEEESCGCSWSSQHGCSLSGKQLIAALTDERRVEHGCKNPDSLECHTRKHVAHQANEFIHCLPLPAKECIESHLCEWGAQGTGSCGIDEQQLVYKMVGAQHRSHPMVKMILAHDHCSKLGEDWCDSDDSCTWRPGHPQSVCDVRPSIVVETFIEYPTVLTDIQTASVEAVCRAQHEVRHGMTRTCQFPCHEVDGVCRLERDHVRVPPAEQIMDVLCQRSVTEKGPCPKPCVTVMDAGRRMCRGPPSIPESHHLMPHGSEHIFNILVDLGSSTLVYQNRCQAPGRNFAQCQEAVQVCDTEEHRFVGKEGGRLIDTLGPSAGTMAGPGFKGVLQKAVQAVAHGKTEEFLEDYLENNPGAVVNLTSKAVKSLSDYFHEPAEVETTTTIASPKFETDVEETVTKHPQVEMAEDAEGPSLPDFSSADTWSNPWVIAAGAAAVALSCSGIAMGALCHAQLLQSQAREPLLDVGISAAGGRLPAQDQELESSFTPPTMVEA